MARLHEIMEAVCPEKVVHFADREIDTVMCRPRAGTGKEVLFVCMDEFLEYNLWCDWRTYVPELAGMNPAAVLAPAELPGLDMPQLIVADSRKALGYAARVVTGLPDKDLRLYGVTGTNGKTSSVRLVSHLLSRQEVLCGSMGTLGVDVPGCFSRPGVYTTPLASELYEQLAVMRRHGARAVAMEVSSHALALDRTAGLTFDGAILTNVKRDHLDFHRTLEAYIAAKQKLFSRVADNGWCVLNRHSPCWEAFAECCTGRVVTFGLEGSGADVVGTDIRLAATHSTFTVHFQGRSWLMESPLIGEFQIENILGVVTLLLAEGFSGERLATALREFSPVKGRMERVSMPNGAVSIVDYAHNPDGLKRVLEACRGFCRGRLHVVFGCGGDRDRGKRSMMGALVAELADVAWVTSDNPRTEDPEQIVEDILAGMRDGAAVVRKEVDRGTAIARAYAGTREGDVLLVAGKGHEDYQIIGRETIPFSDQEVLRSAARNEGGGGSRGE